MPGQGGDKSSGLVEGDGGFVFGRVDEFVELADEKRFGAQSEGSDFGLVKGDAQRIGREQHRVRFDGLGQRKVAGAVPRIGGGTLGAAGCHAVQKCRQRLGRGRRFVSRGDQQGQNPSFQGCQTGAAGAGKYGLARLCKNRTIDALAIRPG